jgi:Right handed beta helix region
MWRRVLAAVIGAVAIATAGTALAAVSRIVAPATATAPAERILPPPWGGSSVPPHARPVDVSRPDRVVGDGTPASCTSKAVVSAVAAGGVITFECGPDPVTITMQATAKVFNDRPNVVIDGGGLVTLDGAGQRRILYMNTCDPNQVWTTSHCQDQDHPTLTIQRLRFTGGNSTGEHTDGGGGGAVFVRGGRVKVVDSTFTDNRCDPVGPDVGGGAIRVLSQYAGRPVIVASSTFTGNRCSNGGALSSIGVSWEVYDSVFTGNSTTGDGANPARTGTPGGGNGGAIALDGNRYTLDVVDTLITDNAAGEGGGAIFFVSNNRTGNLRITDSELRRNPSLGFETRGYPGIFYLGSGPIQVTNSVIAP